MGDSVFDDDIWAEILKRATPKAIGNFMCVSKKWYKFISSTYFINAQALFASKLHQESPRMFLLREFGDPPKGPAFGSYNLCLDGLEKGSLKTLRKFHCPLTAVQGLPFHVVGVVNGVILLSDDLHCRHHTYILWNPVVKKYIQLPQPSRPQTDCVAAHFALIYPHGEYIFASGLGFDSVLSDYKIIFLAYLQTKEGLDKIPPFVELYSVREGIWRSVDAQEVECCITYGTWSQCFMKGSVHWMAFDRAKDDGGPQALAFRRNCLLLFDVGKEKFKRMKVPSQLMETCPLSLAVSEYRGMLAIHYTHAPEDVEFSLDLWVKKIYDVGTSWTKLVSVTTENGPAKALYFRRNREILLSKRGKGLLSYDLETKSLRCLDGVGVCEGYFACPYTETLVFLEKQSCAVSYEEASLTDVSRFVQLGTDGLEEVDDDGKGDSTDADCSDLESIFWRGTWKNAVRDSNIGLDYQMTKFRRDFDLNRS